MQVLAFCPQYDLTYEFARNAQHMQDCLLSFGAK